MTPPVTARSLRGGAWAPLAALLIAAAGLFGCGDDEGNRPELFPKENLPPTTEIVNPELQGGETTYNLLVSWRGYDEDGTIIGFEFAIDDTSNWISTPDFDSLFVFQSSRCCTPDTTIFPDGTVEIEQLYIDFHTLFLRAVDNEGLADPTPDRISFTSTTITPETEIVRGPSGTGSVSVTATTVILEWQGFDEDGEIAGYFYRLDDSPWVSVGADCTVVQFTNLTSAAFVGDQRGFHSFTVYAIDNAGAIEQTIDPIDNTRRWESVEEIGGTLRISSNVLGARLGENTFEGQVFEGTRLSFDWRGDASLYGGEIQCYRFAFDQQETFSACDINSTHFPNTLPYFVPPIGTHNLFVRAFDDAGQEIRANFPFVVLRGPGSIDSTERQILYIDDNDEGTGGPGILWPGDPTEDAFWDSVLAGYDVRDYDTDASGEIPQARDIGERSTLVWYVDSESFLKTSNDPSNFRNPLGPYLNAGGNLILCGAVPSLCFTPDNHFEPGSIEQPGCPHDPRTTYGGGGFSLDWYPAFCDTQPFHFCYDFLKIEQSISNPSVDYMSRITSILAIHCDVDTASGDTIGCDTTFSTIPGPNGEIPIPSFRLDFTKRGVLASGDSIMASGLEETEQFVLRQFGLGVGDKAYPLWRFVDRNGATKQVCGFYVPRNEETGRGHIIVLGFSPFYFRTLEMQALFRTFLDLLGENRSAGKLYLPFGR